MARLSQLPEVLEHPGPGHNEPPEPIETAALTLDAEQWSAYLTVIFAHISGEIEGAVARADDYLLKYPLKSALLAGLPPEGICAWDDEIDGRFTDLANVKLADLIKLVETIHQREKAPILVAQKVIDGFKNRLIGELNEPRNALKRHLTIYKTWIDGERKREAEKEAEDRRRIAEKAAAEAARSQDMNALDRAAEAFAEAEAAQEIADASSKDRTRTHGQWGGVSSLKDNWVWETTDLMELVKAVASGAEPLRYLMVNEPNLTHAVKSEKIRAISGINIRNDKKV